MVFSAAVVQLTTTNDRAASIDAAVRGIDEAAAAGARLVALPENVAFMGHETEKAAVAEPLDGPTWTLLGDRAREKQVYLLAGSLPEVSGHPERPYNTSVLFGPDGQRLAVYRKVHLFDVALGAGATHTESKATTPGDHAIVARTPLGRWGLTICYDLRFPDLFRNLRRHDVDLIFVPSAFTVPTGRDHWEVLLRARAIENQCYVIAPAQVGQNGPHRQTYGRSMIVDPWGTVLATCPDRPSIAITAIDPERVADLRRRLPCLAHERAVETTESGSPE